jgi:hypothetical protein
MEHCDLTSSQFVLCIESTKKIVKQKKCVRLSISVTNPSHRDVEATLIYCFHSPALALRITCMRRTRMNTGDSRHEISSHQNRDQPGVSREQYGPQFLRPSTTKYFFVEKADPIVQRRFLARSPSCNVSSSPSDCRNRALRRHAVRESYFSTCSTAPLRASCHAWAIIPGRRLFRHQASKPNINP